MAITSALLVVVVMTVFDSLDTVSKAQAYQADRSTNLNDMRNVINRMTKDLRQATSVTDPVPATPNTITFTTTINGTATTIVYATVGIPSSSGPTLATLTRKVGTGAAVTVLQHLASTNIFTLTSATDVTGVQWVEMTLKVRPVKSPDTTLDLDSEVNLRNRTATLTG